MPATTRVDATAAMAMERRTCHDFLRQHAVSFTPLTRAQAPEVALPVRLRGPLAGVHFTIPWSKNLATDHHAIWDCRLVVALLPLAEWLAGHGYTEVQYFSALRRKTRAKSRSRHNVGLALDILGWKRGRGHPLERVEEHYPKRRLRSCEASTSRRTRTGAPRIPGAEPLAGQTPSEVFLGFVCHAYQNGLVHTMLTPDHDRAHHNHLHLDLKEGQSSPPDPYFSFHGR